MKAILEFDLPEDKNEYLMANRGADYWNALWELDEFLRGLLKHGHGYNSPEEVMEYIREKIGYLNLDEAE